MAALVYKHANQPTSHHHIVDLPYRLASWAFDTPENSRLWFNAAGELVAWVVFQTPFWTLDCACDPSDRETLWPPMLTWANQHAIQIKDTPSGHPAWFVSMPSGCAAERRILEEFGFADQAAVAEDPWSQVFLHRSASTPLPTNPVPQGFTIRPLAGLAEAEAYTELHREAFQSKNMTVAWRERIIQDPAYRPELDLVAVDGNGRLAGFCVGWFLAEGPNGLPTGQIEPLGVGECYRQLGLGRALFSDCLRRIYAQGAEEILVETDNFRNAAMAFYESMGFTLGAELLMYRRNF